MAKKLKIISVVVCIVIVNFLVLYLFMEDYANTPPKKVLNTEDYKYYKTLDSLAKYNPNQVKSAVEKFFNRTKNSRDSLKFPYAYYYKALLQRREHNRNKDSILHFLDKALLYTRKYGNTNLESNINYEYGVYYITEKDYDIPLSLEYFLKAKNGFEENKNRENDESLAQAYNGLGTIYRMLDDPEKALNFHQKAYDIFLKKKDPANIALYYSNASHALARMGKNDEAREQLLSSLETYVSLKDTLPIMKVLISLSSVEQNVGNIAKSLEYLDQAYRLSTTFKDTFTQGHVLIHYGIIHEKQGEEQKALQYFEEGYKLTGQPNPDLETLKTVADIYFRENKCQKAYTFLDQYYKIKDSIVGKEIKAKIEVLQYENKLKQQQYQAEIKNQKYKKQIYIYLMIIGAISFITVFTWFLYRYKNKSFQLSRLENKKLEESIKVEKEIQRLQVEKYKQELKSKNKLQDLEKQQYEFEKRANKELHRLQSKQYNLELETKNRKLTAINLQLLSRNQLLNDIERLMSQKQDDKNKVLHNLQNIIKTYRNQEKDWELFKETFTKVYPGFLKTLRFKYPDLTKTEVRVCMYIVMRMNNSEIAELLNINHQSLIRIRYHIRKKMKLERTENLDEAIQSV